VTSQNVDLVAQEDVQLLSIDALLPARSPRLDGHSPDHVRVLAQAAAPLPPILVHRESMRIIDGTHRVAAAKLRGDKTIRSRFFDGDERETFAMAVRSNITHGLPLTHADRVAAATEIVCSYPNWSDRAVAATAGLSAATVAEIRRTTTSQDEPAETKRTGLDGRLRPVDPSAGRERVRQMIRKSPLASLRQLAKEAGVSPNTVRRVRKQLQAEPAEPAAPSRLPEPDTSAELPKPNVDTVDTALRWLSQDPSVRHTESGRSAARWFFSRVVRPGEWENVVDALPPHTAYILAKVARQCASAWEELASSLAARAREAERSSKAGS